MTREEHLRAVFLTDPHCAYCIEHRPIQGQFLWRAFLAGANAAMDTQFEPGGVRFGEEIKPWIVKSAPPSENPTPRQSSQDGAKTADLPPRHDLGGEG